MNPLSESWADPHARHAMMVHLPIVLAMAGVVLVAGLAVIGVRRTIGDQVRRALRVVALACFLIGSAGAVMAADAGHDAADRLHRAQPPLSEREQAAVEIHRQRGRQAWVWPLLPAALLVAGLGAGGRARSVADAGALGAALGVAVWFGVIGHAGGRLVYAHGLGVPSRDAIAEALARAGPQTLASPEPAAEERRGPDR